MKVVYLMSYPIYHDFLSKKEWLALINQNRWIPGIIADMGFESEFWVVDTSASVHPSRLTGFGDYTIRMFEPDSMGGRTKKHKSSDLVAYAKKNPVDLFVIQGVDGGVGIHLIETLLKPASIPFIMVTGGNYHHPLNQHAELILYESEYQRTFLNNPRYFFWRRPIADSKLLRMQKSIDIELFKPLPEINKEFDAIAVGRIVKRNKRFDEIGKLARHCRVAVLGDGPYKETLMKKYPDIIWLGRVPNSTVPEVINRAKTYIHPSAKDLLPTRDFYPRAVAEAMGCGLPCIGFSDVIRPDIIPEGCGIIIKRSEIIQECKTLFNQPERIREMSNNARRYAEKSVDKYSARPAFEKVFSIMGMVG